MVGDFFMKDLNGFGNPLACFDALANDVFLPLLGKASIVGSWPDTLTKEVMGQLHKMLANIHKTIGESNGTTQLPMPPMEASPLMDEKEKNYQLETSIVDWAHQIRYVLKLVRNPVCAAATVSSRSADGRVAVPGFGGGFESGAARRSVGRD